MHPYDSIGELRARYDKKEISVSKAYNTYLERIWDIDPAITSYLYITEGLSEYDLDAMDLSVSDIAGSFGSIKDLICEKDRETTVGSKMLQDFIPFYDATVIEKLKNAGSISLGKVNLDEFAMGGSTENSAIQNTKNPWNLERVPGGSSGGSAASVAAGLCQFSLGTDTGGSVRQPASFCGVCGLKPSYGRVSRYGVVPMANSLDQVGIFARDVMDVAKVLSAIAGFDERDATSVNTPVPNYAQNLDLGQQKLRIGVPKEYFSKGLDPSVKEVVEKALQEYENNGHTLVPINLDMYEYAIATYYIIMAAEASTNLSRYDGIRYGHTPENPETLLDIYEQSRSHGFGDEVKRRIMLGTYALSSGYYDAYYRKAQKVRTKIRNEFAKLFEDVDVIMGPTAPNVAFPIGEKSDDPLSMYLQDVYTVPVNLAGLPAISIPCGFSDGMPVGLHIIGKHMEDETVLQAAHAFQIYTDYHTKKPQLS